MTESLHPADGGVGGDVHALGYIGDILAGEGGGQGGKEAVLLGVAAAADLAAGQEREDVGDVIIEDVDHA